MEGGETKDHGCCIQLIRMGVSVFIAGDVFCKEVSFGCQIKVSMSASLLVNQGVSTLNDKLR